MRLVRDAHTAFVTVPYDEPRDSRPTVRIIEKVDPLSSRGSPRQDVTDFEADAKARGRRFRHERIAAIQPIQIAGEHRLLAEGRLRRLNVVIEEMRCQYHVPPRCESVGQSASGRDAASVAADGAGEVDALTRVHVVQASQTAI